MNQGFLFLLAAVIFITLAPQAAVAKTRAQNKPAEADEILVSCGLEQSYGTAPRFSIQNVNIDSMDIHGLVADYYYFLKTNENKLNAISDLGGNITDVSLQDGKLLLWNDQLGFKIVISTTPYLENQPRTFSVKANDIELKGCVVTGVDSLEGLLGEIETLHLPINIHR
jgi:hypothetical protein